MGNKIFANGMEVACKAAKGKTICAFPDVCFTPPQTPATPPGVPIPYPNTGMASDTTKGTKKVKISGKEVGIKNQSHFKKSMGDEAGSAPKKGVITSKNMGKVYFNSWSMDVKFEGKNAVRHLDLTTNNHASMPGDTPPWPYIDSMAIAPPEHPCKEEIDKAQEACKGSKTENGRRDCSGCAGDCEKAMACVLVPKSKDKSLCCKPNNTGHHMIEDHWVKGNSGFPKAQGVAGYGGAPTVCANRSRYTGDHGHMHMLQGIVEESFESGINKNVPWTYKQGKFATLTAHEATFPDSGCSKHCLESQLDSYYGVDEDTPLNPPSKQKLAQNAMGDDRWTRGQAEAQLKDVLPRGEAPAPLGTLTDAFRKAGFMI